MSRTKQPTLSVASSASIYSQASAVSSRQTDASTASPSRGTEPTMATNRATVAPSAPSASAKVNDASRPHAPATSSPLANVHSPSPRKSDKPTGNVQNAIPDPSPRSAPPPTTSNRTNLSAAPSVTVPIKTPTDRKAAQTNRVDASALRSPADKPASATPAVSVKVASATPSAMNRANTAVSDSPKAPSAAKSSRTNTPASPAPTAAVQSSGKPILTTPGDTTNTRGPLAAADISPSFGSKAFSAQPKVSPPLFATRPASPTPMPPSRKDARNTSTSIATTTTTTTTSRTTVSTNSSTISSTSSRSSNDVVVIAPSSASQTSTISSASTISVSSKNASIPPSVTNRTSSATTISIADTIPSTCSRLEATPLKSKLKNSSPVPVPSIVHAKLPRLVTVPSVYVEGPTDDFNGYVERFILIKVSPELFKAFDQFRKLWRQAKSTEPDPDPFLGPEEIPKNIQIAIASLNALHRHHGAAIRGAIHHMMEHPHIDPPLSDLARLQFTLLVFSDFDKATANLCAELYHARRSEIVFPPIVEAVERLFVSGNKVLEAVAQVRHGLDASGANGVLSTGSDLLCRVCEENAMRAIKDDGRITSAVFAAAPVEVESWRSSTASSESAPPVPSKKERVPGHTASTVSQDTLVDPPPTATPLFLGAGMGDMESVRSSTSTFSSTHPLLASSANRPLARPGATDNALGPVDPNFRASHYAFDADGKTFMCGTLKTMIYALLTHNGIEDEKFRATALRTFRFFTTPDVFLCELAEQYTRASSAILQAPLPVLPVAQVPQAPLSSTQPPAPSSDQKVQNITIMLNVAKVLKEWLCKFWDMEKDLYVLSSIRDFADDKKNDLYVGTKFVEVKKEVELVVLSLHLKDEGGSKAGSGTSVAKAKGVAASEPTGAIAVSSSRKAEAPATSKKKTVVGNAGAGMTLKNSSSPMLLNSLGSKHFNSASTTSLVSLPTSARVFSSVTTTSSVAGPPVPPKDIFAGSHIIKHKRSRSASCSNNNAPGHPPQLPNGGHIAGRPNSKFTFPVLLDCDFTSYLLAFSPESGPLGVKNLAQQLTMELVDYFKALDPNRAVEYWRMPKSKERDAMFDASSEFGSPMKRLVEYDNAFTTWVVSTIVKPRGVAERRRMINLWLSVAKACLDLGNLSTACAIHVALTNSRITRMKRTILGIDKHPKIVCHKLGMIFAKPNGGNYLQVFRAASPVIPVIPYLISSLVQGKERETLDKRPPGDKDLKDIDPKERAKYKNATSSGEQIIHLKDFEKISEAIELLQTIPTRYAFQRNDSFSKFVKDSVKNWTPTKDMSENALWETLSKRSIKHEVSDARFAEYNHDSVWTTEIISGSVDTPVPALSATSFLSVPGTHAGKLETAANSDVSPPRGFTARAMELNGLHLTKNEQTLKMTAMTTLLDFMAKVVPSKVVGVGSGGKRT